MARTTYLRSTRWRYCCAATVAVTALSGVGSMGTTSQVASGRSASPVTLASDTSGYTANKWGDAAADALSKDSKGKNAADKDTGSLYTVETAIGARRVWAMNDAQGRPITGQGVTVAVLDSGVSQVQGLSTAGKITYGPDLSIEANGLLTNQDTFGHGTFMAGIIAGRDTTNPTSDLPSAPAYVHLGIAPDANVLAVKLATSDGSTDVSQVIAALDWVTEHQTMPNGNKVRVINLSYGTDSAQLYTSDPLAAAAENAWRHGIVVVVSAGNEGAATGRLTDPAVDPYVLAVGAADSNNKNNGWKSNQTTTASFSNAGSATRHADLIAPGTSIVSARAPGSYIDSNYPSGRVSGDDTGTLFRGSGTSQAAAVVSGGAALILQAYPTLTPDQVKAALVSSADQIKKADVNIAGAGIVDLSQAMDAASHMALADKTGVALSAAAVQTFPTATGQGSIEAARGGSVLVDADGNDLTGEIDVQGNPWNAAAWRNASSTLTAWSSGKWMGTTWTGDNWQVTNGDLSSARWSSARWSSARWSDADWSSARWSSARWSSARWSSARWSSARWSSNNW